MKTKILPLIIALWIVGGWVSTAVGADTNAGKALYEKSCIGCHGADGKGNPAMAKILGGKGLNIASKDIAKKPDGELLKVIAQGSGKMPAAKLSKEEQKQALSYVRSLAK